MNVQFFCYNEDGDFLGIVMARNRSDARDKAAKEFTEDKVGICRAAPL